jgi:site-specific recombinase XerD
VGDFERGDYLFRAERRKVNRPLTKTVAWQLIQVWCGAVDLNEDWYGGHTLCKTWGYQARMQGIGIETIMHKLGQQTVTATKAYLGITQDEINDVERRVNL